MGFFIAIFAGMLAFLGSASRVNLDSEVAQILRRAGEVAETLSLGVLSPRYRILSRIACLQAAVGDEQGAARTAQEVVKSNDEPAAFSSQTRIYLKLGMLHAVAEAKIKRGDLKAAEDLRELARQGEDVLPVGDKSFEVRRNTILAEWQAKAGDFEGAAASAQRAQTAAEALPVSPERTARMGGPLPRPLAFLEVARAFDLAREGKTADKLRERAIADVKAIHNPERRGEQLGRLIYERADLGDRAGALAWLDTSPEVLAHKPSIWVRGLAIRCADGDLDLALRLVDRATDASSRVEALALVARHLGTLGRWREAASVWARIAPAAGDDALASLGFLVDLAYAQARAGDRDSTLATARRALAATERFGRDPQPNWQFPTIGNYARLAVAFWLVGEREQAAELLRKARALVDVIEGRAGVAYLIAEAEGEMGDHDAALRTLQRAQFADTNVTRRIMQPGIEARLRVGDIAAASRLVDGLNGLPGGDRTATELVEEAANRIAQAGDTALGLRWAEAQATAERKALALLSVAQGIVDRSGHP